MRKKRICSCICLALKYLFAMLFPILTVTVHKMTWRYVVIALAEVFLIALLTDLLCHMKRWIGYIFNVSALLLMNIQFAVLYWGSTFVSAVMLANLDSVNALSGKIFSYGLSVALILLFTFLPVFPIKGSKKMMGTLWITAGVLYAGIIFTGIIEYSPYRAVYMLCQQQMARSRAVSSAVSDVAGTMAGDTQSSHEENEFYADTVADYFQKPEGISEKPNVILIFAEGMSQNIIEDPRNIMPNVSALQDASISFANYYNHTFATYMGLSGQLYSGYQLENYDVNYLVSIQDIFKSVGYHTSFINTEPKNKEFSDYLANFGFDELLSDESRIDGMADALSDKAAYEMLFETALEQNEDGEPFFLAMYSFGTHATLDGVFEEFEDGSNALLNRFYDLDVQIGTFMERFNESKLSENTIIVFTSDHATYQDADYVTAFPEYERDNPSLDRIPLLIYYKGITPESYDVNGRNSLDMAPTVLDFLDISAPNYFLGDSLFALDSESSYDVYYESVGTYYCTAGGEINILSAEQLQEFQKQLAKYNAVKLSDDLFYEEYEKAAHVYANVNDDQTAIIAELYNADAWDTISYAVWSEEDGQDDLSWTVVPGNHENYFSYEIDLTAYDTIGVYYVHVYGSMDGEEMTFIGETKVYVDKDSNVV
ncbi:MAG: sulfatase-like hydrolase/transferase [Suilimivivens sp.]